MKRLAFVMLALSFTPSAEAQFFRRLFGGGQQQHCQQPVYYQAPVYYQPQAYYPTYQAVAAIPLATVPVAVDLQAYLYSVNSSAFQSFRDYQQAKSTQEPATPVASAVAAPASAEGVGLTGAVVLKQRCASCHTSGKIPRFFDAKGDLLAGAPLQEMLERVTAEDPSVRMPPKAQLPTREVMAIVNHFVSGIVPVGEKIATTEPSKHRNPFD